MNARSGLLRIIGSLLLAASLAGCSALKLGYSTLPELGFWWLDGYFDFSDEQDPVVRQELARLLAWHRATELPKVVDALARMEQLAPQNVTPAQACAFVPEMQQRITAVIEQAEPAAAGIAMTLAPRQLRQLERKFSRNNAEWRKEMIEAPAAGLEKREKQWVERLEQVYGNLDDAQRAVVREALVKSAFDPARTLRDRQRRQQELLQTLQKLREPRVTTEQARALLRTSIERARRSPDPAYQAWQDAMVQESCRLAAAVHNSTNAEQRAQAARRLRAWQRDLKELAAQPK